MASVVGMSSFCTIHNLPVVNWTYWGHIYRHQTELKSYDAHYKNLTKEVEKNQNNYIWTGPKRIRNEETITANKIY